VFLPKSWPGSMRMRSARTPSATARSARPRVWSMIEVMTSAYSTRCGRVRGRWDPAWVQTSPTSNCAATSASSGSTPPQASLSRSAPSAQTARATSARQVSTLMTMLGKAARTCSTKLAVRRISSAGSISWPGPAFTPPMSMTCAPASTALVTAAMASASWKVEPPLKKESVVRLTIAMIARSWIANCWVPR